MSASTLLFVASCNIETFALTSVAIVTLNVSVVSNGAKNIHWLTSHGIKFIYSLMSVDQCTLSICEQCSFVWYLLVLLLIHCFYIIIHHVLSYLRFLYIIHHSTCRKLCLTNSVWSSDRWACKLRPNLFLQLVTNCLGVFNYNCIG